MMVKKRRKYASGGWSTSVSFDPEDAKRRAAQWAKDHPRKKPAAKPKPLPKTSDGTPVAATVTAKKPSGGEKFLSDFKKRASGEGKTSSPVGSSSRETRGRPGTLGGASMLAEDAPKKLRRQVGGAFLSTVALPLAGATTGAVKGLTTVAKGARAARKVRAVGKAGKAAKKAHKITSAPKKMASGGKVRGDGCCMPQGRTKGRFI